MDPTVSRIWVLLGLLILGALESYGHQSFQGGRQAPDDSKSSHHHDPPQQPPQTSTESNFKAHRSPTDPLMVMTYNILYGSKTDDPTWRYAWPKRRAAAFRVISHFKPAIIGLQEPQEEQRDELNAAFGRTYELFPHKHPFVGIMYDKHKVMLEDSGLFWLSNTPNEEWTQFDGATDSRAVTWGRFRRIKPTANQNDDAADIFYVFNTWLESWEAGPRLSQTEVLLTKIREIAKPVMINVTGSTPAIEATPTIFLIGDMNCNRTELPWRLITGKVDVPGISTDFIDAWQSAERRLNPVRDTWHDFNGSRIIDETGAGHIDYVFYRPPTTRDGQRRRLRRIDALEAGVVIDGNSDDDFPSDHYPVVATFNFP